ncbi:MAG: archaemetzincin family Zn-dependent metalloprotease [Acidobacteriota bacterium]|nr:archaemetzincin family Zn-dependent metalloprotease [Acidobacteriota bacterium]
MSVLRLVPIYCGSQVDMLASLASRLEQTFGLHPVQHPPGFDPEQAYESSRGQYNSRVLLDLLRRELPGGEGRVLGVTSIDLFIPVLTFVFGEAQLSGRAAVVSTHRLDPTHYGLPADRDALFERLCKESIHELGHTFRLLHCADDRCVMTSSMYVDGIDIKGSRLCDGCLQLLRAANG